MTSHRVAFLGVVCSSVVVVWALMVAAAGAANLLDPPGQISGSCLGGFSCSGGDPVECSQAIAASEVACVYRPGSRSINDVLNDAGIDKSLSDVTGNTESITVPALSNDRSWSRSCPADRTVTLMGKSVVLTLAPLCQVFEITGWAVVFGACMMGAKLFGGV